MHSRQVVSCPVQPRARHWSCVFWRDFSGVKRTCWTTGSWRSCLSLEVVSSIPAWSTIIYRFLCGFICVSLCQSIKIKPTNIYIYVDFMALVRHNSSTYPRKTFIDQWLWYLGLYSLSGRTSYRNISRSLEAARFGFELFHSLLNLTGTSATALPRCLSNVRAIWSL